MPMAQRAPRPPRPRPWTRADLARFPNDGNRYEVLDGALLVTPQAAFGHQEVVMRLLVPLRAYCERHGIGVVVGPGAVPQGTSELQPDIQVIPGPVALDANWAELPLPLLVVEVLSDSTRVRDLGVKRDAYLRWGIPAYWVVDPVARSVLTVRAGADAPVEHGDVLRWTPREGMAPFECEVAALFARITAPARRPIPGPP